MENWPKGCKIKQTDRKLKTRVSKQMENKPEDNFPENTSKYWQYGNKVGKKPNQFRIFPTNLKVRNKKEKPDKRKNKAEVK